LAIFGLVKGFGCLANRVPTFQRGALVPSMVQKWPNNNVPTRVTGWAELANYQRYASMTTQEIELKALMLASLNGDATAHRALLDGLSRRLRAYYKGKLARFGRGAVEAEDLVQEAVLAIHLKRHTYDPAEPLTAWVHAIARYKLIDFLRRTRKSTSDVPIEQADTIMAHDDNIDAESTYDLKRLMQRLPEKTRCSIEAVKLDGQSIAEAADRCGISESGVKVNIHRGLKTLAVLIARETRA
jgi:RNA polymerase sigma-70 factor (ECF subfamily)